MKKIYNLVFLGVVIFISLFFTISVETEASNYSSIQLNVPYFPQKASKDCGISSIAMIEAYSNNLDKNSFEQMYASVYAANGNSFYINEACSNGKYIDVTISLDEFYRQLSQGRPILIRREPYEHWSVIVGYNGSSTTLEESGFIVWDTKLGVSACNYNEITYGRMFSLTRWLKAPQWNGSEYLDCGRASLVRARVRGGGIYGSGADITYNPFSLASASNISNTNAQINAELSSVQYVTEGGFYISKNADMSNHTQVKETLNISVKSMWYDMNKWYGTLDAGTTYYYQLYAIINGTQYFTGVQSFTTTGDSGAISFPLIDGQYYYIYNRNAGRVLDIENTAEGAKVILNDKMAGNTNQMWKAVKQADGYSFISCTTGCAMDVYGYSTEDYTEIKQYAYHGNTNQRFQIIDRGEGYYSIHPVCSGKGLDAYNADTVPGTKIIQYGYHGGPNMQWRFEAVDNINPTISNVRVEQMTETSCWIMCEVTDNNGVNRVSFPTWTEHNGQDDLAQNWPTSYTPISGNTYGIMINFSDHNNEEGKYITHIYAYDQVGNYAFAAIDYDVYKTAISLNIQAESDEQTTIQLLNLDGTTVDSTNIIGSNSNLQLKGVTSGTYKLKVSKRNCATRTYTINVGQGVVKQDVELHLMGDITGDGVINARDKKTLFNHIAGTAKLTDYAFAVADVNGDGVINARDKKMVFNHIAGTSSLWE